MGTPAPPRLFFGHLEDLPVLALKGQLRYMNARMLRDVIDELLAQERDDSMILDLSELEAIDSTGLGLLAHVGRTTLQRGRRSTIICAVHDIMTCLRSVAFDTMFLIVEQWPFEDKADLTEIPLPSQDPMPAVMARFVLEAHRDLAELSEKNRRTFSAVISALETDLEDTQRTAVR